MATMSDTDRARPKLDVFDADCFDSRREAILIAASPSSPPTDATAAGRATFASGAWEASA
jgi:hypothetical protein